MNTTKVSKGALWSFVALLLFSVIPTAQAGGDVVAPAEKHHGLKSYDIYAVGGYQALNNGFEDRIYGTTFANFYYHGGLGIHGEVTGIDREEDAGFFAGGLSWNTDQMSVKGAVGTSTDNDNILPELYLRGEVTLRSNPKDGLVFTPSITYRDFKSGSEELTFSAALIRYFHLSDGKSINVQTFGNVSFSDPGSNDSMYGGFDVTYADYRNYSFGITFEGGEANYSSVLDLSSIGLDFFSVRPHVGVFLNDNLEFTLLGEFADVDDYDIIGGNAGLKVHY